LTRRLQGSVTSGTGRGAKFIALPIYSDIFRSLLGDDPFFGTLNLILPSSEIDYISEKFKKGRVFEDLIYNEKEYGGIITIPVTIACNDHTIDAIAVRPNLTTHDSNIVEIVSTKHLRECLNLKDEDTLEVIF
jgi:riboflavin kinase